MTSEKIYDNNIVIKPWGYEYVLYRNSNKLCITYLNINPGQSTSLHSHIYKKTGFLIIGGKARIQLGLYKANQQLFTAPSKLMIRPGLFHSIKNIGKKTLKCLEFESPSGKQDLIRYKDNYGRSNKKYEGKNYLKKFEKPFMFKKFKKNFVQSILIEDIKINIKSVKNLKLKKNTKTIYSLIEGKIVNNFNKNVMPLGDLIKTGTIKKILKRFKIKNYATFIEVYKNK